MEPNIHSLSAGQKPIPTQQVPQVSHSKPNPPFQPNFFQSYIPELTLACSGVAAGSAATGMILEHKRGNKIIETEKKTRIHKISNRLIDKKYDLTTGIRKYKEQGLNDTEIVDYLKELRLIEGGYDYTILYNRLVQNNRIYSVSVDKKVEACKDIRGSLLKNRVEIQHECDTKNHPENADKGYFIASNEYKAVLKADHALTTKLKDKERDYHLYGLNNEAPDLAPHEADPSLKESLDTYNNSVNAYVAANQTGQSIAINPLEADQQSRPNQSSGSEVGSSRFASMSLNIYSSYRQSQGEAVSPSYRQSQGEAVPNFYPTINKVTSAYDLPIKLYIWSGIFFIMALVARYCRKEDEKEDKIKKEKRQNL